MFFMVEYGAAWTYNNSSLSAWSVRAPHDRTGCPDPSLTPELRLSAGIIMQALRDLPKARYREDAEAFLTSAEFEVFCEWLE